MAEKKGGIAALSQGRSDVYKVDPRKIKIKQNWNSRDFSDPANIEHVDNLAQSIAAKGVLEALTVFFEDGQAYVSDGECRLRGAMRAIEHYKAPLTTIPVKSEDRYANEADRLANQYTRNTGKPFSAIELSNHFKRLLGLGWTASDIAKKIGISAARVSQVLGLQTLPEPVKAMVTQGQVAASTAVALVKEVGGTQAEKQLSQGWATAQAEGKDKVLPKHIPAMATALEPKEQLKTALRYVLDTSDVKNEGGEVTIRMSEADYDKLNSMC